GAAADCRRLLAGAAAVSSASMARSHSNERRDAARRRQDREPDAGGHACNADALRGDRRHGFAGLVMIAVLALAAGTLVSEDAACVLAGALIAQGQMSAFEG